MDVSEDILAKRESLNEKFRAIDQLRNAVFSAEQQLLAEYLDYIQDVNIPVYLRWRMFCRAEDSMQVFAQSVCELPEKSYLRKFVREDFSDYGRGTHIDFKDHLAEYISEENGVNVDVFMSTDDENYASHTELMKNVIEDVFRYNIRGFVFDW